MEILKRTIKVLTIATTLFTTAATAGTNAGVEERVREVFKDAPYMVAVIRCESGFRQFDENGNPLISEWDDIGVAQINRPWNAEEASRLGHNLNTVEGNLQHARYMFERYGPDKWTCYRKLFG